MNDKAYNEHKARIQKLLTRWVTPMGLNWFKVDVTWDRSYAKDGSAAITDMSNWKYRDFGITFYMPTCADMNDEELEKLVVHELCHVLLAPISCNMEGTDDNDHYRRDIMELNTEIVASAFLWVRHAGTDDQKAELKAKAKNGKIKSLSKA